MVGGWSEEKGDREDVRKAGVRCGQCDFSFITKIELRRSANGLCMGRRSRRCEKGPQGPEISLDQCQSGEGAEVGVFMSHSTDFSHLSLFFPPSLLPFLTTHNNPDFNMASCHSGSHR